jgi:2-keto-4-pentenoate hydratase
VTTGTCIVPVPIGQGSHVRFDYGPFGEIEAKIA